MICKHVGGPPTRSPVKLCFPTVCQLFCEHVADFRPQEKETTTMILVQRSPSQYVALLVCLALLASSGGRIVSALDCSEERDSYANWCVETDLLLCFRAVGCLAHIDFSFCLVCFVYRQARENGATNVGSLRSINSLKTQIARNINRRFVKQCIRAIAKTAKTSWRTLRRTSMK